MEERLTEQEKWSCTVQWLNALYTAFFKKTEVEIPCEKCPVFTKKCESRVPPPANFEVLEKVTGKGTVISPCFKY